MLLVQETTDALRKPLSIGRVGQSVEGTQRAVSEMRLLAGVVAVRLVQLQVDIPPHLIITRLSPYLSSIATRESELRRRQTSILLAVRRVVQTLRLERRGAEVPPTLRLVC